MHHGLGNRAQGSDNQSNPAQICYAVDKMRARGADEHQVRRYMPFFGKLFDELRAEGPHLNDEFDLNVGIGLVEKGQVFFKVGGHMFAILDNRYDLDAVGVFILLDIQHGTVEIGEVVAAGEKNDLLVVLRSAL